MIVKPPPPVLQDLSVLSEADADTAFREHNDALAAYAFKYEWLPVAVGEAAFSKLADVQVSILEDLYPWVAMFGPHGEMWLGYLQRVLAMLDAALSADAEQVAVGRDFIAMYGDYWLFKTAMGSISERQYVATPKMTVWDATYQVAVQGFRGDQMLPRVEDWAEEPIMSVFDHPGWSRVFGLTRDERSIVLNHFTTLVLVNDLMQSEPAFMEVLAAHELYLRHQNW